MTDSPYSPSSLVLYMTENQHLQIGDSCFPHSSGDGFDGRAHGVEQGGELSCPLGPAALLQDEPGESYHVGVERASVRHDAAAGVESGPRDERPGRCVTSVCVSVCTHVTHTDRQERRLL